MKTITAFLACLALLAMPAANATTTFGTDRSDLWWNAAESGWGAHVTQQGDVLFLVLFVYDSQQRPRFFVASSMARGAASNGAELFEGPLYSTTGPAFATAFDPARVVARAVGTATLRFNSPGSGTLDYTVDGVPVSKAITRQVWRPIDVQGDYKGGIFATATADTCRLGLPAIAYPGTVRVARSADNVIIDLEFAPSFAASGTCRMAGRWNQQGSLASITQGTYACTFENGPTPVAGTFEVTSIESDENGFAGRYLAREDGSCVHAGRLGGFRARIAPPDTEPPPPPPPRLTKISRGVSAPSTSRIATDAWVDRQREYPTSGSAASPQPVVA